MSKIARGLLGIALIILLTTLNACNQGLQSSPPQEHASESHLNNNLLENTQRWRTATDTLGSKQSMGEELVSDGIAEVNFTIARRGQHDDWTPWVELICDIGETLTQVSRITITYKCDADLLVKLSQKDFGEQGNQTWAHYQYRLSPASQWTEKTFDFSGFKQPGWAPQAALGIPLKKENVDAIYLVPDLDPAIGQSATLQVKKLLLQ